MPYNPKKHGKADYSKFIQLPESSVSGIIEGPDQDSYEADTKYALLTYDVAPSIFNLTGDIAIDAVGIDDTGLVKVSGDQLKVFDQEAIDSINSGTTAIIASLSDLVIDKNFSRIVQERDCDSYFAHAVPGTSPAEPKWRVYKLDEYGSRQWADGGQFSQLANGELSGLSYSY